MAKDTTSMQMDCAEFTVMDFIDEHENEFGKVHRAFDTVLSEKQKIKAENVLLKRDNAKLEREVQQGPGVARQEVMVGLMAQVQSLTKVLKDKNKCTDDEQGEHHLPSEKQQCSREDPFVILLGSYLKAKDCQQVPIVEEAAPAIENQELLHEAGQAAKRRRTLSRSRSISSQRNLVHGMWQLKRASTLSLRSKKERPQSLYETDGAKIFYPRTNVTKRFSAPPRLSDVPTANNFTDVVAAGPMPHVGNPSHTSSVGNNYGNT